MSVRGEQKRHCPVDSATGRCAILAGVRGEEIPAGIAPQSLRDAASPFGKGGGQRRRHAEQKRRRVRCVQLRPALRLGSYGQVPAARVRVSGSRVDSLHGRSGT